MFNTQSELEQILDSLVFDVQPYSVNHKFSSNEEMQKVTVESKLKAIAAIEKLMVRERIEEMKLMQGGDEEFQLYSEERIEELKKKLKEKA